jgi:hypothetical protein
LFDGHVPTPTGGIRRNSLINPSKLKILTFSVHAVSTRRCVPHAGAFEPDVIFACARWRHRPPGDIAEFFAAARAHNCPPGARAVDESSARLRAREAWNIKLNHQLGGSLPRVMAAIRNGNWIPGTSSHTLTVDEKAAGGSMNARNALSSSQGVVMSRNNAIRTIAAPASHASNSALRTFARIERAWKLAAEIVRESRAMEKHAWNSNRLPYNGW